mgnify:CR=1 FL=1
MQLDELFQQPQALPAVPKIVHELIDSFNNEDISIEEIARKLAADPVLSARLLRLLLAGVRPAEILAITYTRKAAREIEARLRSLLAELAVVPVPGAGSSGVPSRKCSMIR